jgi:hypothetical protein
MRILRTIPEMETTGVNTRISSARICRAAVLVIACVLSGSGVLGFAQDTKNDGKADTSPRPAFREADASRVLDDFRQALESNSQSGVLKLFDPRRMPGYAAFRNQVAEFFQTYDSIRMNYRVTQVTVDGEFGAVLAEIALEATPKNRTPVVRRDAQARLVLAWDGKAWKITDLTPRNLFRTGS